MPRDGDVLPHGHWLTGAREGGCGETGLLWMHRSINAYRTQHIPGPGCPCHPLAVTQQEMDRPGWWDEPDTASLLS